METPAVNLKTAGWSLAAVFLAEWAARAIVVGTSLSSLPVLGWTRSLEIAILLGIVRLANPRGLTGVGIDSVSWLKGLKNGVGWALGFGLLVGVLFVLLRWAGIDPLSLMTNDMPAKTGDLVLFFLIGALISPVAEEILFRGILYGFFRRWGVVAALLISTFLFVLAHAAASRVPVTQAVGGLLFAAAYERERHLLAPIVIHVAGNAAIFAVALMA